MCLPPTSVDPPTDKSRKMVRNLKLLLIGQIIATILAAIASPTLIIYMILSCLILYLSFTQLDFCSAIVYIFFCGSQLFNLLLTFGTFWQNDLTIAQFGVYRFTVNIILAVFNMAAIWIVFLAYREFKAISMSGQGSYSNHGGNNMDGFSQQNYGAMSNFSHLNVLRKMTWSR